MVSDHCTGAIVRGKQPGLGIITPLLSHIYLDSTKELLDRITTITSLHYTALDTDNVPLRAVSLDLSLLAHSRRDFLELRLP